jgi:hypothetical protein
MERYGNSALQFSLPTIAPVLRSPASRDEGGLATVGAFSLQLLAFAVLAFSLQLLAFSPLLRNPVNQLQLLLSAA